MSHLYELHRFVLYEVPWIEGKRVLDIGCGKGIWGYLLRAEKKGERAYMVALDIHKPYLNFAVKYSVYDDLVLASAESLPFRNGSFDITLACEVIEHLPKHHGKAFFEEIERISSEKVILTTPNGPWEIGSSTKIKSEAHRSAYEVRDFKRRAYKVHGVGFKFVKLFSAKNFGLQKLWAGICYLFTSLSYFIPALGEFLVAAKEIKTRTTSVKCKCAPSEKLEKRSIQLA